MSSSNVIYLRKWHEKVSPFSESSNYFEPRNSYASTRETLELLGAIRRASSRVSALPVERRPGSSSEGMRRPVKQFELSCQRRDTQIGLGAREVGFKCV